MDSMEVAWASFGAQYWPSPALMSQETSKRWSRRLQKHTISVVSSAILIPILTY